jgi:hypothetical protein
LDENPEEQSVVEYAFTLLNKLRATRELALEKMEEEKLKRKNILRPSCNAQKL